MYFIAIPIIPIEITHECKVPVPKLNRINMVKTERPRLVTSDEIFLFFKK